MNKLKRNITKRRRLNNIAYFDCRKRPTLTDEQKQAIKALPMPPISQATRIRRKP